MEDQKYYRSLTRNMMLIMILVSLAPLVLILGMIGYHFETSYRQQVFAHLIELVQKHQQNIDIFLNEKLSYLRVLGNSYTLEQLSDEGFLEQKLHVLREAYGGVFVDLGVVNLRGVQTAYAGPLKLGNVDYADAEWFKKAVQRESFVSDVFLGLRRQPHFIVTVKQRWGGDEWILRATIDFEAFNSLVENVRIGKTGLAFILNRQGEFQTRPLVSSSADEEFAKTVLALIGPENPRLENAEEGDEITGVTEAPTLQGLMKGGSVVRGQVRYAGKDFICLTTPLKNGEWILAYRQDEADAFSELRQARKQAFMIFFLGAFAIVGMAIFLSRRMVRHIERADREKEMMNQQVIEAGKLASIGELAAGIAHEINNPVAIMVEEAGWIRDLLEEEEFRQSENLAEFTRALTQIQTQGIRCKEITHKLLSFARKTDPQLRQMQLNELIQEVVAISDQRARLSNVRICTALASGLPPVSVSPSEMQQVLLNLINNAIDAMGTGGGTLEITTRQEGSFVVFDVADTGEGMPPAVVQKIFDPFFTTKPVGKGTGLGLSICYGIIKKMGGEISVKSTVGAGTTFHVHLPLPKGEPG